MQSAMFPLKTALVEWADMQAIVNNTVILVRDLRCYGDPRGLIVKVNNEEPDGIHNGYRSAREIEGDLVKVVPGYTAGASIWQEGEYEY